MLILIAVPRRDVEDVRSSRRFHAHELQGVYLGISDVERLALCLFVAKHGHDCVPVPVVM